MITPAIPEDEAARLRALLETRLLDTPPERFFDTCAGVAVELCGAERGAVTLVDSSRQWFKARVGELPSETSRDISFCGHAVAGDDVLVVPDATLDPRFADNPLVLSGVVRFYAGVPLHGADGQPLGTLCVIHSAPKTLDQKTLTTLRVLADCLEQNLETALLSQKMVALEGQTREQLATLQELDRKRQRLTAMLVHDMRNPLSAALAAAEVLKGMAELHPHAREALDAIVASTEAAAGLASDMLDVARDHRAGLQAQYAPIDLNRIASGLLRRLRYLASERNQSLTLHSRATDPSITADGLLVERLLRNLLDNALKYGPRGLPIDVRVADHGLQSVEVRIEDHGKPIAEEDRLRIFEPLFRVEDGANNRRLGHGLGLAFCLRVVELHQGTIHTEPLNGGGNAFVVRLPRQPHLH